MIKSDARLALSMRLPNFLFEPGKLAGECVCRTGAHWPLLLGIVGKIRAELQEEWAEARIQNNTNSSD